MGGSVKKRLKLLTVCTRPSCCCDSPAALLLSSVVQVEEVCDHSRVDPQVLYCKLRRMALTVEQMLYGVWCHSTLRTDIWYAAGDASLVSVHCSRADSGQNATGQVWYGLTNLVSAIMHLWFAWHYIDFFWSIDWLIDICVLVAAQGVYNSWKSWKSPGIYWTSWKFWVETGRPILSLLQPHVV